ncbi:FlgB family protein [Citreicella sp. C3M06]|uniref:FlgB family protein n=1 Tax=Roseobacteraceae TaxID=2854170 RepID=UPI001C09BC3C|nr:MULTISPECIES: FlgB family protein [Roseobacteraceae]MBU2960708.1 FlgB family protein [Citreicella sp. C3M06]MDO6586399.1 FlgB family protein [Salipiger sp. 1_MG-2023]
MFQNLDVFRTAMALAQHSGKQQAISSQNIANADTPGYRALEMPDFDKTVRDEMSSQRATRDSHINGSRDGDMPEAQERRDIIDPNGNTVSVETEMVTAVDAARAHNRALSIYRSNLNILRASLGR